jgi:hypothetical protein
MPKLGRCTGLQIAFLTAISLVAVGLGSPVSESSIHSTGSIAYPQPVNQTLLIGWGGKIVATTPGGAYSEQASLAYADKVINDLKIQGYTVVRYEAWGVTNWLGASNTILVHFPVLDHLIDIAAQNNMTVIIDPVHNYPAESTSLIMQAGFETHWKPELLQVAQRYNGRSNVVLECVNEYTLSDAVSKYQNIVDYLRSNNITLPLHFTYHHWNYNLQLIPPNDPLGKTTCGRHFYVMQDTNDLPMNDGESWLDYCGRVGIESDLQSKFTGSSNQWFGPSLRAGRRIICTEIGASWNWKYTRYNVAWCMRFLEYCKMYSVGVTMFRLGYYSGGPEGDKSIYEQKARDYFGREFYAG